MIERNEPKYIQWGHLLLAGVGIFVLLFGSVYAEANERITTDIGVSSGSYEDQAFTEFSAGLNWNFAKYLIWRNAGFLRTTNAETTGGWDTSLRGFLHQPLGGSMGLLAYFGPGYRFTRTDLSGLFLEAGFSIESNGYGIGLGFKNYYYPSPKRYSNGSKAAHSDQTTFILLSIGR